MPYHKNQSNGHNYTESDKKIILETYKSAKGKSGWLDELSKRIGRSKQNICRYARENGLTDRARFDKDFKKCDVCSAPHKRKKYCSPSCSIKGEALNKRGKPLWKVKDHPRGMKGKKHGSKVKKEMSNRMKSAWADKESVFNSEKFKDGQSTRMSNFMIKRMKDKPSNIYSRTQKGWREFPDNKRYFFRSKWEMNIAHYLQWMKNNKQILDWEYEVDTFWFEKIRRGVRSYTPDFKVFELNGDIDYIEVKGWMDKKSATKLKRLNKYYPDVLIQIIDSTQYKALQNQIGRMAGWE